MTTMKNLFGVPALAVMFGASAICGAANVNVPVIVDDQPPVLVNVKGFSLWQLRSVTTDQINSYVIQTAREKKIIVIDGGSPQAPVIQDGDKLQVAKLPSTDDIMKTLQQNNENLLAITKDFKTLSHQILAGKGTVGALLADSTMGVQLKASMRNLQVTTQTAATMAAQLNAFSKKMNTKGGLADNLLTDTMTFNKIRASVTQLQQVAANANTFVQNLNTASKKLTTTDNAIGVLLNDPKGAEQVRTSLNYIQQSTIKLNDDLEAAQHNFFLKGFFKKKAKAEADSLKKASGGR